MKRLLLALTAALLAVPAPASAAPDPGPDVRNVVVVGAAGLRWDDISPETTPAMWRLAEEGSIGALSVRAAGGLTCPADGWVTLGAGNRAEGPEREDGQCPEALPVREPRAGTGVDARLAEQDDISAQNEARSFGTRPGALADGVKCVSAVGPAGALAGAHPSGRIDRYVSVLPANPAPLLASCPVTIVGLDPVAGDGADRTAAARRIDAAVASVDASRPASSLLMVVGVADLETPPHLHVAILDGPGFDGAWLTGPSTRREPYVQLIDVAPTAFESLGVELPPALAGQPMQAGGQHPDDLQSAVDDMVDADRAALAQRPLVQPFFTVLVLLNLAFLAAIALLFRARAKRATAPAPQPFPFGLSPRRLAERAAMTLAALVPASFLANAVPWWRWPAAGLLHVLLVLALTAGIARLAYAGRWGRTALGPPAFVATLAAGLLGLDVMLGSHLQLNSMAGYSPLVAGRFTGFGNLAFSVFAAGALLATGYLTVGLRGRARTAALVAAALAAVAVVGAPGWGGDVGGIIALTPAFAILVIRASGLRLSVMAMLGAAGLGLAAVSMFALLDYNRAAEDRTHLGRFVAQISDGTAGAVLRRKAEANLSLLVDSQLTLLVIAVLVFIPMVLMRRSGGLRRVFGLYPTVRAATIAVMVVAALGFAVNDSGIAVPAFVAALAVPLVVTTALRVLAGAGRGVPIRLGVLEPVPTRDAGKPVDGGEPSDAAEPAPDGQPAAADEPAPVGKPAGVELVDSADGGEPAGGGPASSGTAASAGEPADKAPAGTAGSTNAPRGATGSKKAPTGATETDKAAAGTGGSEDGER